MIPISRVVNASLVSSAFDPALSSDSILIKWRPVTAAGIGSWDNGGGNHTIIMTLGGGGVLVSWLVSLLSEDIMGFILQGLSVCLLSPSFPHPPPTPPPRCLFQIPSPQRITSTLSSTLPLLEDSPLEVAAAVGVMVIVLSPSLLVSLFPSPPARPSRLALFASMSPVFLINTSIFCTRDCSDSE
jgi:hypothetical protein